MLAGTVVAAEPEPGDNCTVSVETGPDGLASVTISAEQGHYQIGTRLASGAPAL